ncbi:two-component regulator propeller domain-containing protein, partial [Persicitalea sp.]|uniref:ligand-binding sensor domain-containing protein n=1 Tax=Persicitalea sp. TaxID=3100273 RepID=UPI0035939A71
MRVLHLLYSVGIFLLIVCSSCQQNQGNLKDQDPTAFTPPVTRPYKLTAPQPIKWKITDPDSISPPTSYSLDIDKLPSKPFGINEFKPLKAPMKEYPLDWDKQPEIPLQFDTLDIKFRASVLPKPVVTKVNRPAILEGSTSGILQLSQKEGLPSNYITSLHENEDGTFWVSTANEGLYLYDGSYTYTYDYKGIYDIELDQKGRLWLVTGEFVYILDFKNNIQWICPVPLPIYLQCDHLGTMWIATYGMGVYAVDSNLKDVRKIANDGFKTSFMLIEDKKNNLWLSMRKHIFIIDKGRKGFKKIEGNDKWKMGFPTIFHEDQKGNVWLGTDEGIGGQGALRISLADNKVRILGVDNGFLGQARVVQEDKKGRIWLLQNGNFSILSEDLSQIKTIPIKGAMFPVKFALYFNTLRDTRGNIWVGSEGKGIILIEQNGLIAEHLDESDGLISGNIWDIEEDSRGNIWLATGGGELNMYDPKKGILRALASTNLRRREELGNYTFKEFNSDKYFVAVYGGFLIIDRLKHQTFHYDTEKFNNAEFRDILVDKSNNFWLPNTRGILVYNTELKQAKSIIQNSAQFPGTTAREIIEDGAGNYWIATDAGL